MRQIYEYAKMAYRNIMGSKMRSFLTMLGIIIGIAAVIAIVTVGNSMTGSVTDSMSGMGVSNITVTVKQKTSGDTQGHGPGCDAAPLYGRDPRRKRPHYRCDDP